MHPTPQRPHSQFAALWSLRVELILKFRVVLNLTYYTASSCFMPYRNNSINPFIALLSGSGLKR